MQVLFDGYKICFFQMESLNLGPNTSPDQLQHIETTIGAGLWYIKSSGIWSGKISVEVINSFHPHSGINNPKLTAEHLYPRKIAASELLKKDWSLVSDPGRVLLDQFTQKYGKVNYVTPEENKRVSRFQRADVFTSPDEAYERAGIQLIDISEQDLISIKRRDIRVIELTLEEAV